MRSLLTPANAYDRSAIMRAAWRVAQVEMEAYQRDGLPALPLRKALSWALRRVLDEARGQRSIITWRAEQTAETVRRSTLPVRERRILELTDARAVAIMIDNTPAMYAECARIDGRLAELRAAA